MRNKRAQGISLNVIIIAAIALVVMVILIALVLRSGEGVGTSTNLCRGLGTEGVHWDCVDEYELDGQICEDGWIPHPTRVCKNSDPQEGYTLTCCIPLTR